MGFGCIALHQTRFRGFFGYFRLITLPRWWVVHIPFIFEIVPTNCSTKVEFHEDSDPSISPTLRGVAFLRVPLAVLLFGADDDGAFSLSLNKLTGAMTGDVAGGGDEVLGSLSDVLAPDCFLFPSCAVTVAEGPSTVEGSACEIPAGKSEVVATFALRAELVLCFFFFG